MILLGLLFSFLLAINGQYLYENEIDRNNNDKTTYLNDIIHIKLIYF